MINNKIYDEIMAAYDKTRLENARDAQRRRLLLYREIPRLKVIDDKIADISSESARRYILGDDEALADLKNQIKSLSEQKSALLSDKGYPDNYLEPIYDCPDCRDSGYIGSKQCHCLRRRLINVLYKQSNIMSLLEAENFSTFDINRYDETVRDDMQKVRESTISFVENFNSHYRNLLFLGGVGSGKTFMSNCAAKALLDKGYSVIYFSAYRLFDLLSNATFQKGGESEDFDDSDIFSCDLLIIDDLGTETVNAFVRSQLFLILNERFLGRKSTIISSNLSLKRLQYEYSERSLSRILSEYDLYVFKSSDMRL